MSLSEEIVQKLDEAKKIVRDTSEKIEPDNYTQFYDKIWKARAEIEFIVITLKLLNNIETVEAEGKWKEEFIRYTLLFQPNCLKKLHLYPLSNACSVNNNGLHSKNRPLC